MPYKPKHPCTVAGCPTLVPSGERHCPAHKRAAQINYNQQRPQRHSFYSSYEWVKFRYHVLELYGRTCVDCGTGTGTLEVDHIIPIKDRPDLALDVGNVQVRCRPCHSRRTAKEHGRWQRQR